MASDFIWADRHHNLAGGMDAVWIVSIGVYLFHVVAGGFNVSRNGTLHRLPLVWSSGDPALLYSVFHSASRHSGGNVRRIHQNQIADSFAPGAV